MKNIKSLVIVCIFCVQNANAQYGAFINKLELIHLSNDTSKLIITAGFFCDNLGTSYSRLRSYQISYRNDTILFKGYYNMFLFPCSGGFGGTTDTANLGQVAPQYNYLNIKLFGYGDTTVMPIDTEAFYYNPDTTLLLHSTGILNTQRFNSAIRIYPNPVANNATIQLNMLQEGIATIAIEDMCGREMAQVCTHKYFAKGSNIEDINAANFKNGIYFLKVITNTEVSTLRFSIQK